MLCFGVIFGVNLAEFWWLQSLINEDEASSTYRECELNLYVPIWVRIVWIRKNNNEKWLIYQECWVAIVQFSAQSTSHFVQCKKEYSCQSGVVPTPSINSLKFHFFLYPILLFFLLPCTYCIVHLVWLDWACIWFPFFCFLHRPWLLMLASFGLLDVMLAFGYLHGLLEFDSWWW